MAEPKQVLCVRPSVREHEREQEVERARASEARTGRNSDHGGRTEARQPQHAAGMHRRTQLQELPSSGGQLGVSGVQWVDGRRAGEQHQLRAELAGLAVGGSDRFFCSRHLTEAHDVGSVPAQLPRHCRAEQLTGLGLETLSGHDERAETEEWKQRDHGTALLAQGLDLVEQPAGNGHGSDLASGHLFAFSYGLAVHHREDGHVTEGIDGVHEVCPHADQATPLRHQPRLALMRRVCYEPRSH